MKPHIDQPVPSTGAIREILIKRIDQQKQATGIVAGVIDPNGRRVASYGNVAHGDPRQVDGNTIFEIGSISKIFTSLALAEMVDRQEVALDDPAGKYLPASVRMPERSGKSITLLDLSTHTSGLPRLPHLKLTNPANPYADFSVDDLYRFLSSYTLSRDPGSEFEYSNLGGGLLGHVLALRAGTDYEELIRSRILQPLGMSDTGITLTPSMQQRMATGHDAKLAPVANWDLPTLAGAGALRSSVNDLLHFLEAFLGYRESPLAPAMKAMLEVRRPAGKMEIGLGWLIVASGVWHNGGTGGFRSFIGFDPNTRTGVVVLANSSAPSGVDDIGFHLLNPQSTLANPEPAQPRTEIPVDPTILDGYAGRYQVTPSLVLEITRDGDRLFAQGLAQLPDRPAAAPTALPKFELFAEGEKNFFAKVSDNRVTFETDSEGRATRLILHRGGRDMPAARIP